MIILHYFLGFPPYRTGGMTTFAYDLMREQVERGEKVVALWPGQMQVFSHRTKIVKRNSIDNIENYEIINPLPVPLDEGIVEIKPFVTYGDKPVYDEFLDTIVPDVIHFHTIMGLHEALVDSAHERTIRTVFTTHDFFPICPKVTLFKNGKVCDCGDCSKCNAYALSIWKIVLLQHPIYRKMKDFSIVRILRKKHKKSIVENKNCVRISDKAENYMQYRKRNEKIINNMSIVHFNSSITQRKYLEHLHITNSVQIPVSHRGILDNRKEKTFSKYIRFTYLGPESEGKGFFILVEALDILRKSTEAFCLNVFFRPNSGRDYFCVREKYQYSDLEKIFDYSDVVIVPSKWIETFGLTALEALSFGVPIIISDTVGVSDILADGCGIVIQDITANGLCNVLKQVTKENLTDMNNSILKKQRIVTIREVSELLRRECYGNQ